MGTWHDHYLRRGFGAVNQLLSQLSKFMYHILVLRYQCFTDNHLFQHLCILEQKLYYGNEYFLSVEQPFYKTTNLDCFEVLQQRLEMDFL